jgi:hypothetical protein
MERSAWPDKRLDDRFDHLDGEVSELRREIRDLGVQLRAEMKEMEAGLRGEIAELRSTMIRLHGATLVVMVGLFAALFARGG